MHLLLKEDEKRFCIKKTPCDGKHDKANLNSGDETKLSRPLTIRLM